MEDDRFSQKKSEDSLYTTHPKKIGAYKIEALLDKGGMSYVYLGTHPDTREPIIVKVLSPKFISSPEVVDRFVKEAKIIAMTDHPNIIKLQETGKWEGGLYIAMEFIQGITLRQYLLQTPISLKRAIEIILDIAYVLCHLHTHGVIHRDLKPENILVTENGKIKVIDFGIAQLLTEKKEASNGQRLIGTPIYMSPEQRENPESVSYPSDIYSLGIISYELILGKLSHGQIHIGLMPKGLQKVFTKALQYKPEDRYHDIVDFITDVTSYLNSASVEKEKKAGDSISELSEDLQHAQSLLIPKVPDWPEFDIGTSSFKSLKLGGGFFDFIELQGNSYGVIVAESSAQGASGTIYISILRGMIRSLSITYPDPVKLISQLNKLLVKDKIEHTFSLSYFVMNPSGEIKFISCGSNVLWKLSAGHEEPLKITAENPLLGNDPHAEFVETTFSLSKGDFLLITHASMGLLKDTDEDEETKNSFREILRETVGQSAQKKVDAILRKIKFVLAGEIADHFVTIICLKKIY